MSAAERASRSVTAPGTSGPVRGPMMGSSSRVTRHTHVWVRGRVRRCVATDIDRPEDDVLRARSMQPMISAADLPRARTWYRDKLGLEPDQEPPDSLVYRFGDTRFIVFAAADARTARHSVASWVVDDLVR